MKNPMTLPLFLLALCLTAPTAVAALGPGAAAVAAPDDREDERDREFRDKDKDRDRDDKDRYDRDDRDDRGSGGFPPGHLPPPGECRVWYDDRPPGHQPPPTDCATARREAARTGGRVIYGDDRDRDRDEPCEEWDEDCWDDHRDWRDRRDRRSGGWWRGGRSGDEEWQDRFYDLDRNEDGYVSRREWRGDRQLFLDLDRNDDRLLSPREFRSEYRYRDRRGQGRRWAAPAGLSR